MDKYYLYKSDHNRLAVLSLQPSEKPRYIMIICHGFRGRKENSGNLYAFARQLNQIGIGVIAFDFTGNGESDGDFASITLSRQITDLKCVIDDTWNNFHIPLLLLGRSFGGTTILAGGNDSRVAGYIFWSTPIHLHDTFANSLEDKYYMLAKGQAVTITDEEREVKLNPDFIQDFDVHDMDYYLAGIKTKPVLIVHGLEDEVVNFANAHYIKNKVENAELFLVDNADHRFTDKHTQREDITINWIKKL